MPITISKALVAELPEAERKGIEAFLRNKAGGTCFLCTGPMNEAADTLVADHDVPSEGAPGKTLRENLNLVHRSCNAAKRNAPSVDVRPVLRLQLFMRTKGPLLKYDGVLPHFGIVPKPTRVEVLGDQVTLEYANGDKTRAPVLTEVVRGKQQRYAFIMVPRSALFNDMECQPRNLKLAHLSSIFTDLQRNPLHEAPGVRTGGEDANGLRQLLMFDGQHKTVASWMLGRNEIACKLYLDLTAGEAIVLVNSIQARIKKLPLSAFELAGKMSDEWEQKVREYEEKVGHEVASEEGFLKWLPQPERSRGKAALQAALVDDVLQDPSLQFRPYLSTDAKAKPAVTESVFKSKVLDRLLHLSPLREPGEMGQRLRVQERTAVLRILNMFGQHIAQLQGPDAHPNAAEKVRRLTYQASLAYVFGLMRRLVGNQLVLPVSHELLKATLSEDQWAKIEECMKRVVSHPVWTADLSSSAKLGAVRDAMQKNMSIDAAFEAVRLDGGYALALREWQEADHAD